MNQNPDDYIKGCQDTKKATLDTLDTIDGMPRFIEKAFLIKELNERYGDLGIERSQLDTGSALKVSSPEGK
jgi:hypothetical protein